MKMIKKIISFAMVLCLVMGYTVVVSATEANKKENVVEEYTTGLIKHVETQTTIYSSPYYPSYGVVIGTLYPGDWVEWTGESMNVNAVTWVKISNSRYGNCIGWIHANCLEEYDEMK